MTTLSSTPHHDPLPIVPLFLSSKESLSPNLMNAPNDSTLQVMDLYCKGLDLQNQLKMDFLYTKTISEKCKKEGCC